MCFSSVLSFNIYIYILFHTKVLFHEFVFTEPDGQTDRQRERDRETERERETVTQWQRQRDCVSERVCRTSRDVYQYLEISATSAFSPIRFMFSSIIHTNTKWIYMKLLMSKDFTFDFIPSIFTHTHTTHTHPTHIHIHAHTHTHTHRKAAKKPMSLNVDITEISVMLFFSMFKHWSKRCPHLKPTNQQLKVPVLGVSSCCASLPCMGPNSVWACRGVLVNTPAHKHCASQIWNRTRLRVLVQNQHTRELISARNA